jgi:hypothetical protein
MNDDDFAHSFHLPKANTLNEGLRTHLGMLGGDAEKITTGRGEVDGDRQRLAEGVLHERVFLEELDELWLEASI